ncbi:MAG: methyltransferase [Pseudomonadota bacterium]
MAEAQPYDIAILGWLGIAALTFLSLFFISAPYGRHARRGWGPAMPARPAWVLMEIASPVLMALFFFTGGRVADPAAVAFILIWQLHYLQRTFVYPALMRPNATPMPVSIVLFGVFFNLGNAYFNGRWVFHLAPEYGAVWLTDPRFIAGVAVFAAGFFINLQSDGILRNLRKPGETGYRIPQGGLYRWVSSPNYLGEMMEWAGWALATWSLAGLTFFLWTAANLLPRAVANHRWYRETFEDYPRRRRAVVPFLF